MTVGAIIPKKRSLFPSTVQNKYIVSVPFALQSSFIAKSSTVLSADINFPWCSGVDGAEINSLLIDSDVKGCNVLAQLLDSSGRVVSTLFPVARLSDSPVAAKIRIGLHEFQKIRFYLLNSDITNSIELTILGKIFLNPGVVTCSNGLRRRINKWQKEKIAFKASSNIKDKKFSS